MMGAKRKVHDVLGPIDQEPESKPDQALEAIFEELAEAVKMGDAKAGVEALRAFVAGCRASETSEE